jgi:predicted deacetylase
MAIQLNLETSNFGVPFQGAYFRIVTAAISRQRQSDPRHTVMIDVVGYATQPTNEDTKDVDFRRYHVPLTDVEAQTGEGFLAKCYEWVMTQTDMAGSVGV